MSLAVFDTLLILHFVGLMMGAGGGLGSTVVMGRAMTLPPEQGAVIRALGPALSRLSLSGLVLMWVTGAGLFVWKYNAAFSAMPLMFWVKMAAAGSLTFAAVMIELTYGQVKRGDTGAGRRFSKLGPMAGMSSLAAVIFAVLAFH